ncbi:extracellular solute-binding protein, partial [bacterium]
NRTIFRQKAAELRAAGLDPERAPRTWSEIAAYSKVITERDKKGNLIRAGFMPNYGNSWLYIYAFQNNASFLSADGRTCTMATPETEQALKFVVDGYDAIGGYERAKTFESGFQGNENDPFTLGKVAMKIDGDWVLAGLARFAPKLDFGAAPAPVPDDRYNHVGRFKNEKDTFITWVGGYSYAIPKGAHNIEDAWTYIKWAESLEGQRVYADAQSAWDRSKGRPEPIRALNRIAERESGEPLVSLIEGAPSLVIHRPAVIPYLRETVVAMVERAASSLPEGYRLGAVDAWRPFVRQQRIYDFLWESAKEAFPHRDDVALRRTVCRWVAPVDQKAPPGHCTGEAIDVFLLDESGEAIDVWSPYDRWQAASTYTLGLIESVHAARTILVEAMLAAGFSNCRDEWWHYSYGDAGWAVRMGETSCSYGLVELAPDLYAEQEEIWVEAFKERTNPFLPPEEKAADPKLADSSSADEKAA